MNPIKPKFLDAVKVDWKISKRSKNIISLYSKYTRYEENEIVDKLISDIMTDKDFIIWLNKRRYQKKIQEVISDSNDNEKNHLEGETDFEKIPEDCEF